MIKRPIDHQRDAAISMQVGDATDGAISEAISLGDRLLIVKEESIWQVQLADDIDPERSNSNIPNTHQKLLSRGSTDPLVGRTLLQAKRFAKNGILPPTIVIETVLGVALSFLTEADALRAKLDEYNQRTRSLNDAFKQTPGSSQVLQVPAVGDVSARGKAFIQAADHSVRPLWTLARIFHPELPVGVSWSKLTALMQAGSEDQNAFAEILLQLEKPLAFLRNTRNAVEHPKPGQEVIFEDYRLKSDGTVYTPTIEVIHKDTPLAATELQAYFTQTLSFLIDVYECLLIQLCALHVRSNRGFPISVVELAPDERRYPHVKYAYASELGGRVVPFAD